MQKLRLCQFAFVIVCLTSVTFVASQYVGEQCYVARENKGGVCKKITDCPSAIDGLRKRIFPQQCGFLKTTVIVCCIEEIPTTTTTTMKATTDSISPTPHTILTPGELSRQKCKEYEDLAYREELSPILIESAGMEKIGICPWESRAIPAVSGGIKAELGEFPHMAFLRYKGTNRCGGSLISGKFVLTAGHCIDKESGIIPISVRLGDASINDSSDDTYVQEVGIRNVFVHPNFSQPVQYNDIALIELERSVTMNVYLKPACLYTKNILNFDRAIVTGWGKTEEHVVSDDLLKATLDLFPTESCNERFKQFSTVFPNGIDGDLEVCAGSYLSNKDTCGGDSGTPLQIYNTDVYCSHYIVGITSFGIRCGETNNPAVYTKIYPYLEWIESIVWPT